MKKVSVRIKAKIVVAYIRGLPYKQIEAIYGVNRWNIQDALSKAGYETDRIKSPPRLPGSKKKEPGKLMDRYHDGDFLPPMKPKKNPVLEDDQDIMERMDGVDDYGIPLAGEGTCEIVVDENDKVRYEKNV